MPITKKTAQKEQSDALRDERHREREHKQELLRKISDLEVTIVKKITIIAEKEVIIAKKEAIIAEKEAIIAEKEAEKEAIIAEKEAKIDNLRDQVHELWLENFTNFLRGP